MSSHKRVKDVDYDDDDLYSGDEGGDELSEEDKQNFATLTPVVRAELDEVGVKVADKAIEEALWHYYWDVGKSVAYLKKQQQPKTPANKPAPAKEATKKPAEKGKFTTFPFPLSLLLLP